MKEHATLSVSKNIVAKLKNNLRISLKILKLIWTITNQSPFLIVILLILMREYKVGIRTIQQFSKGVRSI